MGQDDRLELFLGTVAEHAPRSDATAEQVLAELKRMAQMVGTPLPCPVINLPPFHPSLRAPPLPLCSPPYSAERPRYEWYAGGGRLHSRTRQMLWGFDVGAAPDRTVVALVRSRMHHGDEAAQLEGPGRWEFLRLPTQYRPVALPAVKGWRAQLLGALVSALLLGRG